MSCPLGVIFVSKMWVGEVFTRFVTDWIIKFDSTNDFERNL